MYCVLFSGKGEAIETTLAALQVVPEPFRSFANTLVDICAYAGQSIDFSFFLFFLFFLIMTHFDLDDWSTDILKDSICVALIILASNCLCKLINLVIA